MNNEKIKVSIIIPVYNVENLLYTCIESIINQSLDGIEIIIINDGSTDNSASICDKLSSTYSNIRVIHKINEGVSVARNTGIKLAKGEYIGFVDSDDYIHSDMYLKMYRYAKNNKCDIVMCDANIEYLEHTSIDTINQLQESKILDKKSIYPELLMEMAGSMWKCLYSKNLLIRNNIACPIGIKLSEDRIFNILAFGYCQKIFYLKESLYTQRIRSNSATTKYYDNMLELVINARNNIFEALDKSWNKSNMYKICYEKQNLASVLQCIRNEFHRDCKKSMYARYKSIRSIISDKNVREIIHNIKDKNIKVNLLRRKSAIILTVSAFIKYRD